MSSLPFLREGRTLPRYGGGNLATLAEKNHRRDENGRTPSPAFAVSRFRVSGYERIPDDFAPRYDGRASVREVRCSTTYFASLPTPQSISDDAA